MHLVRESSIEKDVCAWAKSMGILAIKFTPMGETGWPDRIFLHNGKTAFIEFKATGKKARPLQEHRIHLLRVAKFNVGVYDNVTDAITFLETTLLSSGRRKNNDKPSGGGTADGPRTGEDKLHLHGDKDITESRLYKAYFSDMPLAPSLSRVATPKR